MRVLIVKMSSMGDIIHALPAVSDAAKAIPAIQFDWLTEEAFTEIPRWHPQVKQVIPIGLRRWRKNLWLALKNGEVHRFYTQLRQQHYDKIIDAQGSIKSALTSRLGRGYRLGMDRNSVRETFADLVYQKKFPVPREQHAIFRLRQLFAQAFEYPLTKNQPCYGIANDRLASTELNLPENYLVFVPNASWPAKCWPENAWSLLSEKAAREGFFILIPWGNEEEKERALRIGNHNPSIRVLPKLSLGEIARVLGQAKAAVCVDTGLSHLAAALGTPAITLYTATNPQLIGTIGPGQIHLQSKNKQTGLSLDEVWQALKQLLFK